MSLLDKRFACLSTPPPQVPPVITLQPQNVTVDEGTPWNVTSSATGATSSEWYKDGSPTGNTTDTFAGAGLVAESGSYFNRYTNAIGDTDTNTSTVTINPDVVPRTIIQVPAVTTSNFNTESWSPAGVRTVSATFARTANGVYDVMAHGNLLLECIPHQGRYIITPNLNDPLDVMEYTGNTALPANELNKIEVQYQSGAQGNTVVLSVNDVVLTPTTTTTRVISASGAVRFGAPFTASSKPGTFWMMDFILKDSVGNEISWSVDEAVANVEDSTPTGTNLTYNNIPTGLPTREVFTQSATQWLGDNGTVLTINYP